jgi:zinc protease
VIRPVQPQSLPRARRRLISVAPLLYLLAAPLQAQHAVAPIPAEQFTLPNGLEVILAPDHGSQVVAVDVWYLAGSRDESPAKAGLARLFERLMFGGSAQVPAGVHAGLLEQAGGVVNGEVGEDVSRFSEAIPSNRLGQALWLEADRMRGVVINDSTVNEGRLGLLNDLGARIGAGPYTGAMVEGISALYDSVGCPGYSHPPTGWPASLAGLTTADARAFFDRHYRPNAARLVVAGDFDPAQARQLISAYFGSIARGPGPDAPACTAKFSPGPVRRVVGDRFATQPAVGLLYRVPPHDHPDTPALALLGIILGQGQGGRLNAVLQQTLGAVTVVQAGMLGTRLGPGAFGLFGVATPGVGADSLTALLAGQAAWAASGVTEADLTRARNIYLATALSGRERPLDVAEALQHAALYHASPDAVVGEVDRTLAVSLADLRRVAAAWLRPDNALTVVITPGAAS